MVSMDAQTLLKKFYQTGVVAVLIVERAEDAVPLARALFEGGVDIMELTLRTPVALDALRAIRAQVPEMIAGVGTILSTDQLEQVISAGAAFGVAPGLNPNVVRAAQTRGLPFYPGIATPTDIEHAWQLGCQVMKFFPAEPSGGLAYLQSIAAPYEHLGIRYIPLGGIRAENLQQYVEDPRVLAIGGTWLAPKDLIQAQDWKTIARHAREAHFGVQRIRSR